jgi:hypothetical protein
MKSKLKTQRKNSLSIVGKGYLLPPERLKDRT